MNHKGIDKLPRFIFLNFYAFLLLILGVGIGVIPLYKYSLLLTALQIIVVCIFLTCSVKIFASWKHKKRDYSILMQKNEKGIVPTSFSDYMQAPCGRLLTIVVLYDLCQLSMYKELKKLRKPFKVRLKEGCVGQKTVVVVYKRE